MSLNYMYSGTNTHECDVAYHDGSNWIDIEDGIFFDGSQWHAVYQRDIGITATLDSNTDELTITFTNGTALTGTPTLGVGVDKEYPTQTSVAVNSANILGNSLVLSLANTYAVTDLLFFMFDSGLGDLQLDAVDLPDIKRLVVITV